MAGYCLCLDDLFYFMLSTLKKNNIFIDKLTYREMHSYGDMLIEHAKTKNIKLYLYLCRESTSKCLYNHRDFIKEDLMYDNYKGIKLIKTCTQEEFEEEFRTYMPLDVLLFVEDDEFVSKIIDKYNKEHGLIKSENEHIYWSKTYYLTLADLFFNMIITLKEANINVSSLTYKEVEDYGFMLKKFGEVDNINICLKLGREETYNFYSDYYDYVEENNEGGIKLKKDFDKRELIKLCLGYLPLDLLKIILNKNFEKNIINKFQKEHHPMDDSDTSSLFKICSEHHYLDNNGIARERKPKQS